MNVTDVVVVVLCGFIKSTNQGKVENIRLESTFLICVSNNLCVCISVLKGLSR